MREFKLRRLGIIMEPDMNNIMEAGGVLNPAAVRGKDGNLYLFPRMATKENYSRIGIAKVIFNEAGDPVGVERLGIALEPEAPYEKRPNGAGGCEDPRVSFVEPLGSYVMTYTAFTDNGPRIALAESKDLLHWNRLGLTNYEPYEAVEFNGINNKDGCFFPTTIPSPHDGFPSLAMLHRPLFPGTRPEEIAKETEPHIINDHRECIWISYSHFDRDENQKWHTGKFTSHHPLVAPQQPWEDLKVGAGTPPVLTRLGWMFLYHGVGEVTPAHGDKKEYQYSAGIIFMSANDPCEVIYKSEHPVLKPDLPEEKVGVIAEVVFPTGIDRRDDIGMPDRYDVYYGMADDRIGVARLDLPESLPTYENKQVETKEVPVR